MSDEEVPTSLDVILVIMFIFPNTFPLLANKSLFCVFYFIQNEKKKLKIFITFTLWHI